MKEQQEGAAATDRSQMLQTCPHRPCSPLAHTTQRNPLGPGWGCAHISFPASRLCDPLASSLTSLGLKAPLCRLTGRPIFTVLAAVLERSFLQDPAGSLGHQGNPPWLKSLFPESRSVFPGKAAWTRAFDVEPKWKNSKRSRQHGGRAREGTPHGACRPPTGADSAAGHWAGPRVPPAERGAGSSPFHRATRSETRSVRAPGTQGQISAL